QSDFDINVMGFVRSMKTVLPNLLVSEQASVVLYSTVAVKQGMPFHASVAAAKGALEGLTRSLAAEYAPKIRVNAVAPSLTQTPLAGKLLSSEEKIEKMNERHPLKRIGTPQDMAEITCFLLSESSSWMTGQILGVDGGMSSLKIN
ncbi:MAG: SDR family NAD(P)-dependent oxidoreductase, partial [Flavobacteriaceae bacterium]